MVGIVVSEWFSLNWCCQGNEVCYCLCSNGKCHNKRGRPIDMIYDIFFLSLCWMFPRRRRDVSSGATFSASLVCFSLLSFHLFLHRCRWDTHTHGTEIKAADGDIKWNEKEGGRTEGRLGGKMADGGGKRGNGTFNIREAFSFVLQVPPPFTSKSQRISQPIH